MLYLAKQAKESRCTFIQKRRGFEIGGAIANTGAINGRVGDKAARPLTEPGHENLPLQAGNHQKGVQVVLLLGPISAVWVGSGPAMSAAPSSLGQEVGAVALSAPCMRA